MKQRTYWQWGRLGLTWQIGILLITESSLLVYVVFQTSVRRLRCEPIQGTIIKSNLKPCENGLFSVDIAFRYTVERIPYNRGPLQLALNQLRKDVPDCRISVSQSPLNWHQGYDSKRSFR